MGGVLVANAARPRGAFAFFQNCDGRILSPFESWLMLRGVKTLAVRMRQHDANGRQMAACLAQHPRWRRFSIRGCRRIRSTSWRSGRCRGFGALITFETASLRARERSAEARAALHAGREPGRRGDADLASRDDDPRRVHPAGARALGIGNGLVRISVGIEDAEDLVADLTKGLDAV